MLIHSFISFTGATMRPISATNKKKIQKKRTKSSVTLTKYLHIITQRGDDDCIKGVALQVCYRAGHTFVESA